MKIKKYTRVSLIALGFVIAAFFLGIYSLLVIVPIGIIALMKLNIKKKYTRVSIIVLGFAIAALLLLTGDLGCFYLGIFSLFVIVPIGVIVSIIAMIKEKTNLSIIVFILFLLIPVGFWVALEVEMAIHNYTMRKKYEMTDGELLDAYERISGIRPLCVLEGGSEQKYLLDIARIDCDTIGDHDILLQYECSEIHARYFQLIGWDKKYISDSRDVVVVHYIFCEDKDEDDEDKDDEDKNDEDENGDEDKNEEDDDYKVRRYYRYEYSYKYTNGSSEFYFKSDRHINNSWSSYGHTSVGKHNKILNYYDEHKSEIPVIAEEITKSRNYVRFTEYTDIYLLEFKRFGKYEDFTIIAEHLRECYGATISDVSEDGQKWSASVKIGESVMDLYSGDYNSSMFRGSLNDMPVMEKIADYFEVYIAGINTKSEE